MSRGKSDRELEAIGTILGALDGLDGESIQRVFDYVLGRLSISRPSQLYATPSVTVGPSGANANQPGPLVRQPSIRDLKEEKQPESSNQMAALVAYYLSELASEGERKDGITSADLEKYFKQAGFKLPQSILKTLPNAAAAGYFDPEGHGRYRLNAVGYNLVVHGLPRTTSKAKLKTPRPR